MSEKRQKLQTIIKQFSDYYKWEVKALISLLDENLIPRLKIAKKLKVTPQAIAKRFPKEG